MASSDMDKLKALGSKTYFEQAKWFLNAYLDRYGEEEAEKVWNYAHKMAELDERNGKEGGELDELYAHRFLEQYGETMTVLKLREVLRAIDIDTNKKVSLTEYLISNYKCDWHELVNAAQSDNKEEIDEAVRLVEQASAAVVASQEARQQALEAENEARKLASAARDAEANQRKAEAATKAALAELEAEEKAYADKKADLENRSENGGLVSRNKAKNELQQLLAEDPLPLQRAKINQGATVRAQEKSTQAAVAAREEAEAAAQRAADATAAADQAVQDAEHSMRKAEEYLEEVKSKPGSGAGAIWWMERELHEQRKFMPQKRGGISKN